MRRGILADRDEFRALRERTEIKPFDSIHQRLERRCALILETQPVTEVQWRSMWQQGSWESALLAARTTQGRILDLLVAHRVDPNTAYRDRAVEEVKNLVSWTTWVDPCHDHIAADLCTAEAAVAAAIALDWLWEDLVEADRGGIIRALRDKAIKPYLQAVEENAWWYNCYHNWNAVVNGGIALAAMALADEDPDAEKAVELAKIGLRRFFDALGREGGWDEGTGYWGYAMRYLLLLAEAQARLMDDQSLYHKRGMSATGLFPVYFTPNGHAASFGDAPIEPLHGTMYLLVRRFGLKEVSWWLDTYSFHRDVATSGWSDAGLAMLFRPVAPAITGSPDLSPVKVFSEIGWAAMADHWPRPGLYVAAKTGDLSANHSQRDMNSIQLQADGEMLLTDPGHGPYSREYFSAERGGFYHVQARAHNTIIVSEDDQRIDAQGAIVETRSDRRCRWIACDAGDACGENTRFIRHVVMIVDPSDSTGRMVIVLDELTNGTPEKIEQFWHTHGLIELDRHSKIGAIVGRRATMHFALTATVQTSVSTKSRNIDPHRSDNFLHVSGGLMGEGMLLSVFSPARIEGKVAIEQSDRGAVEVKAGGMTVRFKPARRHLKLAKVSAR